MEYWDPDTVKGTGWGCTAVDAIDVALPAALWVDLTLVVEPVDAYGLMLLRAEEADEGAELMLEDLRVVLL